MSRSRVNAMSDGASKVGPEGHRLRENVIMIEGKTLK